MKSGVVPGGRASVAVPPAVRWLEWLDPAQATEVALRAAATATAATTLAMRRVGVVRLIRHPSFSWLWGVPQHRATDC